MAVATVVVVLVGMRNRIVRMGAVVMVGMAQPVAVAMTVAAEMFVGEGLPCHRFQG